MSNSNDNNEVIIKALDSLFLMNIWFLHISICESFNTFSSTQKVLKPTIISASLIFIYHQFELINNCTDNEMFYGLLVFL